MEAYSMLRDVDGEEDDASFVPVPEDPESFVMNLDEREFTAQTFARTGTPISCSWADQSHHDDITEAVESEIETESEHMTSLRKLVSCALCKCVLKNAHCFPACFHAFCDQCVEKILADVTVTSCVSCPICSMPTARKDIVSHPLMERLIEMYGKLHNESYPCAPCGGVAEHRCVDCRQDFCSNCKTEHTELPVCRGHRFISCQSSADQPIDLVTFCQKHPDQEIEFNCETCEKPICNRCFVLEHRQKECRPEDVNEANERLAPFVDNYLEAVSRQRAGMDDVVHYNAQLASTVAENASEQKKQIQTIIDLLIIRVQEEGKNLMARTETLMNEQLKPIFEQKEEAEAHSARLQGIEEWTRSIMGKTTGSSLLVELQTRLLPLLKGIAENPKKLQEIKGQFIKFKASKESTDNILVGEVIADIPEARKEANHSQGGAAVGEQAMAGVGSGEAEPSVSKVINKIEKRLGNMQWFDCHQVPIRYSTLLKRDITTARHFFVDRFCYQFCIVNELLWLPCHLDDNVLVYNFDGDIVTTITPDTMRSVRALRPLEDGRFVVACANGLFLTNETFASPDCIHKGSFADVATDNGRLFALDCAQNRVTVFTKEKYGYYLTHFTIDGVVFDAHDRIRVKDDHVFVSSASYHTIAVTDTHGQLLHYFNDEGSDAPGKFKLPNLCGVSDEKEVLVLDNFNSSVQILDSEGQWHMWEAVNVTGPHDLLFDDENTMWVLCSDSVKRTQIHKITLL